MQAKQSWWTVHVLLEHDANNTHMTYLPQLAICNISSQAYAHLWTLKILHPGASGHSAATATTAGPASHAAVNMSQSTLLLLTHYIKYWFSVNATCYTTVLQFKYQYCRLSLHQWCDMYHTLDWLSELHVMCWLCYACMQICHRGAQHDMGVCSRDVSLLTRYHVMRCIVHMHACKLHRLMNGQICFYMTADNSNESECCEYCFSLANFFSFCICKKNLTLNMKVRWVIWLTLHLICARALLSCSAICEFKPAYAGYRVKLYVLEHAVCPNQWNLSTRNKVSLKWSGCLLRQKSCRAQKKS